jgi:RNA polymerase sigma-70 factor (ECF subfamily)
LLNVAKKVHGWPRPAVLNGQPATVFVEDGIVLSALVLDILEGRIVGIRVVSNPDKLARLSTHLEALS